VYETFCKWENKFHPSTSLTRQEIEERWEKIFRNWEKSGLSKGAYCRAKRLDKQIFYRLEKKFNPHISRKTRHMEAIERWTPIVADWKKSGLNKLVYCRKHRLSDSALRTWAKRLDSPESPGMPIDFMEGLQIKNLQEYLNSAPLETAISIVPLPMGQKIEVTLSPGQHFCLGGPVDWQKLNAWLTPLLTR